MCGLDRTRPNDRARWIRDLVSDMRKYGLEPVPKFLSLAELYIEGAITLVDLEEACRLTEAGRTQV